MAKLFIALCLLSCLVGVALSIDTFTVQGRVFCDTLSCWIPNDKPISFVVAEPKVIIEYKNYTKNEINQIGESVTDSTGTYNIEVRDAHEEEICEVVLVESSRKDCSEVIEGRDRARIMLTDDVSISSSVSYANSLGFFIETPLPICGELLQSYALFQDTY